MMAKMVKDGAVGFHSVPQAQKRQLREKEQARGSNGQAGEGEDGPGKFGSSVPGILWARILEWVAISFSKAFSFLLCLYTREIPL